MILGVAAIVQGKAVVNKTKTDQDLEAETFRGLRAAKRYLGQTQLNQWVADPYDGETIGVIVNTTHCGFKSTPLYFTTLTGNPIPFQNHRSVERLFSDSNIIFSGYSFGDG